MGTWIAPENVEPRVETLPLPFRLQTARDALALIEEQIGLVRNDTEAGTLEKARRVGYLAGVGLKAVEVVDAVGRVEALEGYIKSETDSMTDTGPSRLYDRLTPMERFSLFLNAMYRDDTVEIERLGGSCPRKTLRGKTPPLDPLLPPPFSLPCLPRDLPPPPPLLPAWAGICSPSYSTTGACRLFGLASSRT